MSAEPPDTSVEERRPITDLVLGGVLAVIGIGVFIASAQLDGGSPTDPLGPRGFPNLLSLGFIGAGVALFVRSALAARDPGSGIEATSGDDEDEPPVVRSRLLLGALAVVVYVAVGLPILGYLLSSIAFVAGMIAVQGGAARRSFIAMTLGFPIAVYLLFGVLLNVSLPIGIFFVDPIDVFSIR